MGKSNKKYLVKGLKKNTDLQSASIILFDDKLKNVFIAVDKFLEDDSEKNLHQLRIALRRFRYIMESLYLCVDDKLFSSVLKKTKDMLDSLGEGRDQDVLAAKLRLIEEKNKFANSKGILKILDAEKEETRQRIKLGLIKYICDENVNKFFKKNKLG
jgi:CHAD domain-containing protein